MLEMSHIEIHIPIPQSSCNYDEFSRTVKDTIISLFNLDTPEKRISLEFFENNQDHGLLHVYTVWKKALYIADTIEDETGEQVDRTILYVMILAHDSWRSHRYLVDDRTSKEKISHKHKTNDRKHPLYWTAQVRLAVRKLQEKGMVVDPSKLRDVYDYVYNHDYLNDNLSGGRYKKPRSLEWQIARLADRVSESVLWEVKRYRETGKRMGTPYFISHIPLEARKDFHFGRAGEYAAKWWLDQCMFFGALLSIKPQDFSHPVLQKLYKAWAIDKKDAIDYIMKEAENLWYDKKTLAKLDEVITYYAQIYDFTDILWK